MPTGAEFSDPSSIRPWPADRVERWPIERVIPYASNPRVHSEADLDKIAASIRKWGWTAPPLVDEAGVLIVGHARVAAAVKIGETTIPVIVARGWSEEEKTAIASPTINWRRERAGTSICYAVNSRRSTLLTSIWG